jgi:hypothetical protein
MGLNTLTALKFKKTGYIIHLLTTLQKAYHFLESNAVVSLKMV